MSHYETAEQRRIRELRSRISSQERQLERARRDREILERQEALAKEKQRLENQRLQNRVQSLQNDLRIEQSNSQQIQQLQAQLNEKDRILQERMARMKDNHAAVIRELNRTNAKERQSLQSQMQSNRKELERQIREASRQTDAKIKENARVMEEQMRSMRRETQEQIRQVDQRISQLQQTQNNHRELAQFWLSEAQRYLNQLRNTYHAQLFDAKQLDQLIRAVSDTQSDLDHASYQTAISTGRQAVYDAMDLREEMMRRELEWNALYNRIREAQTALLQQLQSGENRVYEFEVDGKTRSDERGLDYWSYGFYHEVKEEINDVNAQLEESALQERTLEEMRALEEKLRELSNQMIRVENAAQTNLSMSLSRAQTARMVGQTLDEGYAMSEAYGAYFGREQREEYHALFKNPVTGKEAVVTITPIVNPLTHIADNHIDVLVRSSGNDAVATQELTQRVASTLEQSGIDGCRFPCSNRPGAQEEMNRVGAIASVRQGNRESRTTLVSQETQDHKQPVRIKQ